MSKSYDLINTDVVGCLRSATESFRLSTGNSHLSIAPYEAVYKLVAANLGPDRDVKIGGIRTFEQIKTAFVEAAKDTFYDITHGEAYDKYVFFLAIYEMAARLTGEHEAGVSIVNAVVDACGTLVPVAD